MNQKEIENFTIATEEDLNMLFQNEIQREIFKKIVNNLITVITERTSLHGLKLYY